MRRARQNVLSALVAAGTIMVSLDSAHAAPRSGVWAGDGVVLTLDSQGGRLEFDCGYATLPSPVTPDRKGRFKAVSAYFPAQTGRFDPEAPAATITARIAGTFTGDRVHIVFKPGDGAPETFDLGPGKRRKLIRCL